jgi:hypothetical protein
MIYCLGRYDNYHLDLDSYASIERTAYACVRILFYVQTFSVSEPYIGALSFLDKDTVLIFSLYT